MKIFQSRSFERKVKKFTKQAKDILDDEVKSIAENLTMGIEKKGALRGVFVHKFKKKIQYLISYRFMGGDLELIMIGPHENYYRDLKSCLKYR